LCFCSASIRSETKQFILYRYFLSNVNKKNIFINNYNYNFKSRNNNEFYPNLIRSLPSALSSNHNLAFGLVYLIKLLYRIIPLYTKIYFTFLKVRDHMCGFFSCKRYYRKNSIRKLFHLYKFFPSIMKFVMKQIRKTRAETIRSRTLQQISFDLYTQIFWKLHFPFLKKISRNIFVLYFVVFHVVL